MKGKILWTMLTFDMNIRIDLPRFPILKANMRHAFLQRFLHFFGLSVFVVHDSDVGDNTSVAEIRPPPTRPVRRPESSAETKLRERETQNHNDS